MKAAQKPDASEASGVRSRTPARTADQRLSDKTATLLIALVQKAFAIAANVAVAENDRLGISTHSAVDGKLVVRPPPNGFGGITGGLSRWP